MDIQILNSKMTRHCCFLLCFLCGAGAVIGEPIGTVSGRVEITTSAIRQLSQVATYSRSARSQVADATVLRQQLVVHLADDNPEDGFFAGVSRRAPTADSRRMIQRQKMFHPYVLPVVRGTEVSFPNEDAFYHNVFSLTTGSKFDLGKYSNRDQPGRYVFEHPGIVEIYCDIHRYMRAYVLVLEHPFFVQPAADGSFLLGDVPPGRYTLQAWHPDLPMAVQTVEVPAGGHLQLSEALVLGKK